MFRRTVANGPRFMLEALSSEKVTKTNLDFTSTIENCLTSFFKGRKPAIPTPIGGKDIFLIGIPPGDDVSI